MSSVVLDTNILLDLMLSDRPDADAAAALLELVEAGATAGIVSAGSLKDVYYIARKHLDDALVRSWIRFFMDIFAVAALDKGVCGVALDSAEPDFEDGIVRAIAEIEGADFILTRDADAFQGCRVRPLSTRAYLDIMRPNCAPTFRR